MAWPTPCSLQSTSQRQSVRSTRRRRGRCPASSRWSRTRTLPRCTARGELDVLQSPRVAYRGQIVAAVVASRDRAGALSRYTRPHDVELRRSPGLPTDDVLGSPTDTSEGDLEGALVRSAVTVDEWFTTPAAHANPMEPHASLAFWEAGAVTVYESSQFAAGTQAAIASAFDLAPEQVRVICPYVGGGFGSKGEPRPHMFVAIMAASVIGRPVKIALTRRQMFPISGYRSPSVQRVRLGADEHGRLPRHRHDDADIDVAEFAEPTAVDAACSTRRRTATAPACEARRADALDARARRVPGHVRARVGDRRAGRRLRHRSDRAPDPQRARGRSRERAPVLEPQPRRLPARGRRAFRLAAPAPARRSLADRLGRRGLALPDLPMCPRRSCARTPTAASWC